VRDICVSTVHTSHLIRQAHDNSFHRNLGVVYSWLILFTVDSVVQLTFFWIGFIFSLVKRYERYICRTAYKIVHENFTCKLNYVICKTLSPFNLLLMFLYCMLFCIFYCIAYCAIWSYDHKVEWTLLLLLSCVLCDTVITSLQFRVSEQWLSGLRMPTTECYNELSSCWDGRPDRARAKWAEKCGQLCHFLWGGGAGSPFNTMSPGARPTYVPCGILIHPAVWPQ